MGSETALGRANVAIRAVMDKLDGDLAGARSKVDGAVKSIAQSAVKNLQVIGTGVLAGIGTATGAVLGLGAALAKITVDAAPVEGLSRAFEGLAVSAGYGADEMLAALQRGSGGMISQRDLMMSFNKAASLVSKDFAVQLPDAMQYLSKVSAATGTDMGYLLDSLVTGVGRLSPMILDNLSIQVSLAEATDRAAQMYGKQASELSKAEIQAGMMAVSLEKLAINTASMPDVTESAATKLAQLRAGFQDTKDRIGVAFLPALASVLDIVADLAERFLPPLSDFLTGTLAPAFERAAFIVESFIWMLDVGIDPIKAIGYALELAFGPEVSGFIMNIVNGVSDFITAALEVLEPVIAWVSENVKLQDVLIALGAAVLSVVLPALWAVISAAAPVVAVFIAVVAIVALLRTAWEENFLGIRDIAAAVWGWLQTNIPVAVEAIRGAVTTAIAAIRAWWAANSDQILSTAQTIWNTIQTVISTVVSTIQSIVQTVMGAVQSFWQAHGDTILSYATLVWDSIRTYIQTAIENVKLIIQAITQAIQGDWRGFGETLRKIWDNTWDAIKNALSNSVTIFKDLVTRIVNGIIDKFKGTDWGQVGKNIIEGIANGITAGIEWIKNAAKNAAKAALDAAKGFLGIQSPSRKAAAQIGVPFSEGVSAGVMDMIPRLRAAAQQMGGALMDAADGALFGPSAQIDVSAEGQGPKQVNIYGLTLEGVQDRQGLLAELQALT